MARVKLNLPERFEFSTEIPVQISDINYGGHMGNDALLSMIHEARLRFLKRMGYSEMDTEGAGLIMTDAVICYASEAFHGEILKIEVAVDGFARCGFDFFYRVTNAENSTEIARAKTGMLFFDYEKRKAVKVPEKFRSLFAPEEP